jgi:hypothetical protein
MRERESARARARVRALIAGVCLYAHVMRVYLCASVCICVHAWPCVYMRELHTRTKLRIAVHHIPFPPLPLPPHPPQTFPGLPSFSSFHIQHRHLSKTHSIHPTPHPTPPLTPPPRLTDAICTQQPTGRVFHLELRSAPRGRAQDTPETQRLIGRCMPHSEKSVPCHIYCIKAHKEDFSEWVPADTIVVPSGDCAMCRTRAWLGGMDVRV